MTTSPESETAPRAGRATIVGRPNVGKSTLLNALLGQKLAIATPKPGTTRTVLLGVYDHTDDERRRTQIALYDTPGLETPRTVLGRVLVEEAQGAIEGNDVIVFLVDASDVVKRQTLSPPDIRILDLLLRSETPIVLGLNKVDKVKDKRLLLPALDALHKGGRFAAIVPVCALRGTGVDGLVSAMREHLKEGLVHHEEGVTDRPERFFVAELVREALLAETRAEVPHGAAVQVDEWHDEGKLLRIGVTIVVEKDSHKGIVIGAGGQRLKSIGEKSRAEIEAMLDRHVFLRTFVKVIPGWTTDPDKVRRLVREGEIL
jgi:GTPase